LGSIAFEQEFLSRPGSDWNDNICYCIANNTRLLKYIIIGGHRRN